MRKFRFVGEPENYEGFDLLRGGEYYGGHKNKVWGNDVEFYATKGISTQKDWEEIFEDSTKPLHKDTDLGHFSLEIMKSVIKIAPFQKPNPEATNELFAKDCIALSKELIKQLNEETK